MKRKRLFSFLILCLLLFYSGLALSQAQKGKETSGGSKNFIGWNTLDYADVSVSAGRFLPFGIAGVTDNYPMWGIFAAHPSVLGLVEYEFLSARGEGVILYNGTLGLRWDFGIFDALEGFFGFGANYFLYQRKRTTRSTFEFRQTGGYCLKWGVFQPISDALRLRADFKFNSGPGRTLYVGLGLNFRY